MPKTGGNGIDLPDVTAGEWLERCGSFLTASYRAVLVFLLEYAKVFASKWIQKS
jgi:hypothetical protein